VAFANRRIQKRRNYDGSTTISITVPDDMAASVYDHLIGVAEVTVDQHRTDGQTNRDVVEHLGGIAAVRADAAVALLTQTVDSNVGFNPDLQILVDIDELATPDGGDTDTDADGSGGGGVCQLRQSRLAAEIARRCGCETNISALIEDEAGNPLGVGRTTRIVPRRLRRALERRDQHMCQFHGCGQTRRLHAHHIIHWIDGGETELDNLILLCSFHHHVVHEGQWTIRLATTGGSGGFEFITPAGAVATVDQLNSDPMRFTQLVEQINPPPNALMPLWAGERPNMSYITSTIIHNEENRYQRHLQTQNQANRQEAAQRA
jgi:hypothetical protein